MRLCHNTQAVGVAVKAHRNVAAVLGRQAREIFGVRRPHAVVDIETVGRIAHCDHFGTEFMEDVGRNVIRCSIGAVDQNAKALKIGAEVDRRLAELDVPARRIV